MQQPEWIEDSTGKITGYKTPGGADTVFPFKDSLKLIGSCYDSSSAMTFQCTSISSYKNLTVNDFMVCIKSLTRKSGAATTNANLTKNYNAATGILTVSGCCYSTNGYVYYASYDVYALS